MSTPFAVQLYSVRDLYKENFAECVKRVAHIGYRGVECFGPPTLPAEQVKAELMANNLELVGWHLPIELFEIDQIGRTIDYLKNVGCTTAIVPWYPEDAFTSRESILILAERLTTIQNALSPHGIDFGYHNHTAEFIPLPDGTLPWALLMDNSNLIGQLDNGNALVSKTPGLDTAALAARWPGRAKTVHAKPYSAATGHATMIGDDDIDWAAFLKAAKGPGSAQWVIVEFEEESLYGQFEGIELCLRAIEKY